MPKLIETYALQTGLKIDKPFHVDNFFPLPDKPFVLLNASSGMPSKNYDYFNDVIRMLQPFLTDYVFLQVGGEKDTPLIGAAHLQGKTTLNQLQYLIRKAALLIGNDSQAVHIASAFDTPLVALYGPTNPAIHGPFWGDKNKQRLIESHRMGNKPTYSAEEPIKTINFIKPENVAQAALELLGFDSKITTETLHIGGKYPNVTIELVCDQILNPNDFPGAILNARMDYKFDENFLFNNLAQRKLCIVTDKPINVNVLKQLRANVMMVVYMFDHDNSLEFVKEMRAGGIPYTLVTTLKDEDLSVTRLKFFDLGNVVAREKIDKTSLENHEKININTLYRSNRFILSDGKIFLNKLDWEKNRFVSNQFDNERTVIDDPEFFQDSDYFYYYNGK